APAPDAVDLTRSARLNASTHLERGWHAIARGDDAAATDELHKALALVPDDTQAVALHGWAMMLQEQYDEALLQFHRVLQRDPAHAIARVNVGYLCLKKGIYGEAIEHLTRVIAESGDRKATLYAHFYLGLLYSVREMYVDAEAFLARAVTLGPNLVEAWYELGRARWFGGNRDGARQAWRDGAAAGKFSPWGRRCADMLADVERGGGPSR
ncbi:MAG: tetratricopeptide repeat protein, partial [Gammaproteobacteria bacterium]|nr:tetratricopeptide repeat protein [Gammaproteobacteria bacterium]